MKLQIDNFDGNGLRDYSRTIEATALPQILRRLNQTSELRCALLADNPSFIVPANGSRIKLQSADATNLFTGYLIESPAYEYLGWGQAGPVYRYDLVAKSDEIILDRKRLPDRPSFTARSAGNALRQLTEELLPGVFDTSGVPDLDALARYVVSPQQKWSEHAAEIALQTRASYRAMDGALFFSPVGNETFLLDESAPHFSPEGLKLTPGSGLINDITVIGRVEPQAYVTDYFVGDNLTLRFYLSQQPFTQRNRTLLEEEYKGIALDPTRWTAIDPGNVISVTAGKLQVAGGTGTAGQTTVEFREMIELGGAFILQHGDITFSAASDGILGGLYNGAITFSNCLAGFRITPSGAQSNIQAVISGVLVGSTLTTIAGHHYVFTSRFCTLEIYRKQQIFHSSAHPAGSGRGGGDISAKVRVVLEVHDIDPSDPGSIIAASTVLYDGLIDDAPGYCAYALVNSITLHCEIAFTRLIQAIDTEVRSARPSESFRTRLVGSLSEGAECLVTSGPTLQFFPQSAPIIDEHIEVRYRGQGLAIARVLDPASIAAHVNGDDDGVRGVVRDIKSPSPRTVTDCENAALAQLDDALAKAWIGEYETWNDFLPAYAEDIFPGDGLTVSVPTRGANFTAIVRKVEIQVKDFDGEHSIYKIHFADDAAQPLDFEFQSGRISNLSNLSAVNVDHVGSTYLPDLTAASLTDITSTTVTLDAGLTPPAGGGIEVRRTDFGWGPDNDRNLVGRFTTQTFTVTRLSAVQDFFLRRFDDSTPPRYSRYSAALHIGYPL